MIGALDVPDLFLDPARVKTARLWFGRGHVECQFPNNAKALKAELEALEFLLELSSEVPGTNANWPSDIASGSTRPRSAPGRRQATSAAGAAASRPAQQRCTRRSPPERGGNTRVLGRALCRQPEASVLRRAGSPAGHESRTPGVNHQFRLRVVGQGGMVAYTACKSAVLGSRDRSPGTSAPTIFASTP